VGKPAADIGPDILRVEGGCLCKIGDRPLQLVLIHVNLPTPIIGCGQVRLDGQGAIIVGDGQGRLPLLPVG
jgi:hypothetical protein